MDISGSHRIAAPRSAVWAALNDPAVLKDCIPGCERFERVGDGVFEGAVATKVGPMRTVMTGVVTLVASEAPGRATITAKGADPASGGGEGVGEITLTEDGEATVLGFEGSIEAEGKVGQLGQRLLTGVTKKQIETTCANLAARLHGAAPVAVPQTPEPVAPPLVHEEPVETPPVVDAPPLAEELAPVEPTPIAPTQAPIVPEPDEIAASAATAGSGATTRIMLVAAIVAVAGAIAWYMLTQTPPI